MENTIKELISKKHGGDEKQLEVIFTDESRILVNAPAGYGKTHTMVSKIAYMIATNQIPNPKKLLALTFSLNAAYKIKKDVIAQVPSILNATNNTIVVDDKVKVSNYHGFCRHILKLYGYKMDKKLSEIEFIENFDDSKTENITKLFPKMSSKDVNILVEFNSCVKDKKGREIKDKIDNYNNLIINQIISDSKLPYNAIITLTIKLLRDFPKIQSFYQDLYCVLLVDEFQDTNILSYWILTLLTNEKTKLIFLGDELQRIYGFIGAYDKLFTDAEKRWNLKEIKLTKNYRFRNNPNMLLLDQNIRKNAEALDNKSIQESAIINFVLSENQEEEAKNIISKVSEIQAEFPSSKIAILVKSGKNKNTLKIIDTLQQNNISFFFGLFTDEDVEYTSFTNTCTSIFSKLLIDNALITKRFTKKLIKEINIIYSNEIGKKPIIDSSIILLEIFCDKLFTEFASVSNEEKISLIRETFENNNLRQYIEFVDSNIIFSTIHGAKGLEWDFVIMPDMEQNILPSFISTCKICQSSTLCKVDTFSKIPENIFLEELSVFYVGVTRARKNIYFSASKTQIYSNNNIGDKNISCFLKLKGITFNL
jgi:DNA helicase-2/ATP-dependent DNA helicase PcrA